MSTSPATKMDTKTAIMDTAESMMAEHGVNGVSIRAILAEAGANPAALHYHFNSREGLIEAMMARHGHVPASRRVELIAEFDRSGRIPTAQDLVNLIVDPVVSLLEEKGEAGRRYLRFIARLQSDRTGLHIAEERKVFPEMFDRMEVMFQQACPDVSIAEVKLRFTMVMDSMLQSLSNAEFMAKEWDGEDYRDDLVKFAAMLKTFLVGGLAAAATTQ